MSSTIKRSTSGNFIPTNAEKLVGWGANLLNVVDKYISGWTHIPKQALEDLRQFFADFEKQQSQTTTDSPRSQITRRNERKDAFVKQLRYFIKFYLRNPVVTNDQLNQMGIPPLDTTRTIRTEVNEQVDFSIKIKGTNNIIVDFKVLDSSNKAKPTGYSGAVIIWAICDEKPVKNDDYQGHTLATKTPYTIEFDDDDSGKRVWVRAAWQNGRGILGRWTEAQTAIVP